MELTVCDEPIFVVGAPRSGTSMMQWSLRQHPELWGGQESDYLSTLVAALKDAHELGSARGKMHWLSGQKVDWAEFARHVGYGVNALYMNRSGGRRWVEQTPGYTHYLTEMVDLFPGARFLYMLRDGRSVVQSLRNFVNPVGHEDACGIWKASIEAGLAFRASGAGDRMYTVRYETIITDTAGELARIYEFLGMEPSQKSVDFIRSWGPINSSFSGETADKKLEPRWATWTPEERQVFAATAGDLLVETGYEKDDSWAAVPVSG